MTLGEETMWAVNTVIKIMKTDNKLELEFIRCYGDVSLQNVC